MPGSLVQIIDPPSLGRAHPAYANVTVVPVGDTNMIKVAGQVAYTPTGEVPETLEEQFDLCFSKVETCLSAAGATVHDLTRLVYYVAASAYDYEGNATLKMLGDKIVAKLQGHKPTSCLLVVAGLSDPRLKVEVEGEAAVRR